MAVVKAFKGMRFTGDDIVKKVTPPYDIISEAEQDSYYNSDEHNIIRLEYGKVYAEDDDTDNKYIRAGKYLKKWLENGVLAIEDKPVFYVYEEVFSLPDGTKKSIKGLVARVKLQEFSDNVILPHEETLSKAKEDRFNLMQATFSNFSQIYSLYMDEEHKIPTLIENAPKTQLYSFTDEDGIEQNLWKIEDEGCILQIEKAFSDKQLFIADGHHRYETGLRFKKEHPECEGAKDIMMFLIDLENDGLVVFPTHRVLRDMEIDFDTFLKNAEEFDVEEGVVTGKDMPSFILVTKNADYTLTLKSFDSMNKVLPDNSEAYRNLDVNILHKLLLEKLGIDSKNMAEQKNLIYTRSETEARQMVQRTEACCAFLINATKVSQIKDVSLAGEKMPQKSTYFYPKLKTGLVMNKF